MPSKQSSGQKRAQGGGRTPNSEPKLQVFKEFGGLNFELASRFNDGLFGLEDLLWTVNDEQTDLQMNFMFLQDNVSVTSNKTLETRNNIRKIIDNPHPDEMDTGLPRYFTGAVQMIGNWIYAALDRGHIARIDLRECLDEDMSPVIPTTEEYIDIVSHGSADTRRMEFTDFQYLDNKLIALSNSEHIWSGDIETDTVDYGEVTQLESAIGIDRPPIDAVEFVEKGSLTISSSYSDSTPFRTEFAYCLTNKFGPTELSDTLTIYTNHPVSEWHSGCYARIRGGLEVNSTARYADAVEMYYTADNAQQFLYLARLDLPEFPDYDPELPDQEVRWAYDWFGYVDATNMWPIANLIAPTENYTEGVRAEYMNYIDGRVYFWGYSNEAYRLYVGGNPGNLLSVSPGTGGGFVDVEPGSGQYINHVCKYKTQSGNSIVTMLCSSANTTRSQRFNLVEDTLSLSNEQSMRSYTAEQVAGAVGCASPRGALVCEDGLYTVDRLGLALTTLTMEYNSQIRTNYVSSAIKPVFLDSIVNGLGHSILIECDGVIYMALGNDFGGSYSNIIFCYDIDLKSWWTYSLDSDIEITNMFHIDWEGAPEGIGIVTNDGIYMLPIKGDTYWTDYRPDEDFLIETAQISTLMPQQGWQYLSQLEFHFDYFIGNASFDIKMFDIFGREVNVHKEVEENEMMHDYVVHMRIDQRVMSYAILMNGVAKFRMTHFIARVYTLSNKIGQVWGFDDKIGRKTSQWDIEKIHPTFKCYNDIRKAIFT